MKKIILSVLILLSIKSNAQNPTLNDVNAQLRNMFANLDKPTPHKNFLYDMVAHVSNDSFYDANSQAINSTDDWFKVYEEMYHSAYDTTVLTHPDNLLVSANSFPNNIIPIGIMNYNYYQFVNDALTTNNYFDFDTINDVLTDKYPRPTLYPYDEKSMFMASTLIPISTYSNPTFRVDPQFIFFDQFTADNFNNPNYELRIDFGDGNGWIAFNPHVVTLHQVTYTAASTKSIRVGVFLKSEGSAGKIKGSSARLLNPLLVPLPLPTETFDLPGLTASWFPSCTSDGKLKGRTVIYVEGIDVMDFIPSQNRTGPLIYSQMIQNNAGTTINDIVQLRNQGYDFLVVDWKNSRVDMRFNALYLVNLIQWLKQQKSIDDHEQFVVIGESMGGVISRYALTYMETDMFKSNDIKPFFQEANDINNILYLQTNKDINQVINNRNWDKYLDGMHQTRLFISLDAPHQGANIPISIQKAYRHTMNIFGSYIGSAIKLTSQAFNLFLDGQAAQQLLIYHIDKEDGSGFYKTYDNMDEFKTLRDQIKSMGNYPQFAKVMLMSNGSLNGRNQFNFFTNQPRLANDRLIDFHASLYARILWFIKIPIFGGDLTALTNPDGQGPTFKANLGTYRIRIKLKWFGIKISSSYSSIFGVDDYADTRPYCTSAGSFTGANKPLVSPTASQSTYNLANGWLFNLFSYDLENDGKGCINFNSHVGLNGFASINADYSLCTDGALFGFIPTASALDYKNLKTIPLNYDIDRNDDINTKLSSIDERVDVLSGIAETRNDDLPPRLYNQNHLTLRNNRINNFKDLLNSDFEFNTCWSCVDHNNFVKRGFLNLEIGDEELYLENNTLIYPATYRSEYDILVNVRNPHYEYPNGLNLTYNVPGVYSREKDFGITNNGFATFIYDPNTVPSNGLQINGTLSNYVEVQSVLDNCCRNYQLFKQANPNTNVTTISKKAVLNVYPNPSNGSVINLDISFLKMDNTNIELYDLQGKKVLSQLVFIPKNSASARVSLNLNNINLSNGIYFLKVSTKTESLNSKIIISK